MRITAITTYVSRSRPNLCYAEVETESGLVGLGETFWSASAVATEIHERLAAVLIGEDARDIERLNVKMRPYLGTGSTGIETRARSTIDMALWDLLGQSCGLPLHVLLGGKFRDGAPIYNTCVSVEYVQLHPEVSERNWAGDADAVHPLDDRHHSLHRPGELAREYIEAGIKGMKIWPFDTLAYKTNGQYISRQDLDEATRPFKAIRDAVGSDIEIICELHSLWNLPSVTRIAEALEPFDLLFIEDPLPIEDVASLRLLRERTRAPVALSETAGGAARFEELCRNGAMDYAILDVGWCGGLTEAKKIAAVCEAHGVPVTPHDCTGPVNLIASTNLSISLPNAFIQETVRAFYLTWYPDIVTEMPRIEAGVIRPPEGPGLGSALRPEFKSHPDTAVRRSGR